MLLWPCNLGACGSCYEFKCLTGPLIWDYSQKRMPYEGKGEFAFYDMAGGVLRARHITHLSDVMFRRTESGNHPEGQSCSDVRYRFDCLFSVTLLRGAGSEGHAGRAVKFDTS